MREVPTYSLTAYDVAIGAVIFHWPMVAAKTRARPMANATIDHDGQVACGPRSRFKH